MDRNDWLAKRLEAQRTRMRVVAYRMRMLASLSEADDAVQEASLHIS
jgi:DNA-directed RNA polymerase specialized sigma24 family protein